MEEKSEITEKLEEMKNKKEQIKKFEEWKLL